jgi:hypothetical protein
MPSIPPVQIQPPILARSNAGSLYLEQCYDLPTEQCFNTVNLAVWITLRRRAPDQPLAIQEGPGCVLYTAPLGDVAGQLFLLYASPKVTVIRLHPYGFDWQAPRRTIDPGLEQACRELLTCCQALVLHLIGQPCLMDD